MKPNQFDFRLWSRDANIYFNPTIELQKGKMRLIPINDENVEIELWSGFVDKNGVRIFENDLLKLTFHYSNSSQELFVLAKIDANLGLHFIGEEAFMFPKIDYIPYRTLEQEFTFNMEVIDNIHDNKKHLKFKQEY